MIGNLISWIFFDKLAVAPQRLDLLWVELSYSQKSNKL
jgi:hypothetical protein